MLLSPTRFTKNGKRSAVNTASRMESVIKDRWSIRLYPIREPKNRIGVLHKAGCDKEEMRTLPMVPKDTAEKVNKRRINDAERPKM